MIRTLKAPFSFKKALPVCGGLNASLPSSYSCRTNFQHPYMGPILTSRIISNFSTNPKEFQVKKDSSKKILLKDFSLEEFIEFIKDKGSVSKKNNYTYTTDSVYIMKDPFKNRLRIIKGSSVYLSYWYSLYLSIFLFAVPAAGLVYMNTNHLGAVIPLVAGAYAMNSLRKLHSRVDNTVLRMELLNKEKVALHLWCRQEAIVCNIEGAKVQEVKKIKYKEDYLTDDDPVDTVLVYVEFTEDNEVKPKKHTVVFRIAPGEPPVENLDLFKTILSGETSMLQKFENIRTPQKTKKN